MFESEKRQRAEAGQGPMLGAVTSPGYAYPAEPTTRDKGSLERELDGYANNLDTLERMLANLAIRLTPVSRQDAPRPGNGAGKAIPTASSQVAVAVQAQNQKFESLLESLSFITERIDL